MFELLKEKKIENQKLENIDTIKYVIQDKSIFERLYDSFIKDYENTYGKNKEYIMMKVQDMLYRLHLLINYNFKERHGIVDKETIRNAVSVLIDNEQIDFYDAVSYDYTDQEIVDLQDFDVCNVLFIKNI